MKKQWLVPTTRLQLARFGVLFAVLLGFTFIPDKIRQGIFGPKVEGEPLYLWQFDYRARCVPEDYPVENALGQKLNELLRTDTFPRWRQYPSPMGSFEYLSPDEKWLVVQRFVNDHNAKVRSNVARTLRECRAAGIDALIQLLDDPVMDVRCAACNSLCSIGPAAAAAKPGLLPSLSDPSPQVRYDAARALWFLGNANEEVLSAARREVQAPDPGVRVLGVYLLGMAARRSDDPLADLASVAKHDPDASTRERALHILTGQGERAVPFLAKLRPAAPGRATP